MILDNSKLDTQFLWCFARLHSDNSVLQCCRKMSSFILWMSAEVYQKNGLNCLWVTLSKTNGFYKCWDQIWIYNNVLKDAFLKWAETYHFENPPQNKGQMILKEQIELFLIDYIEHCFPTCVMSFLSFKVYLRKFCEFFVEEKMLKRIFNCFAVNWNPFSGYVCLASLLKGLAYFDSECPSL